MSGFILDSFPSQKNLLNLLKITLVLFPILMVSVNYVFGISNYPVSFTESQLSFSGDAIRSHFAAMTENDVFLYKVAQAVDYIYIVVYGLLIFSVGIFLARKFKEDSKPRFLGYIVAISGITASCCDGLENLFILFMTADTVGFPDIFALVHSYFAACKFALLGFSIVMVLILIFLFILQNHNSNK